MTIPHISPAHMITGIKYDIQHHKDAAKVSLGGRSAFLLFIFCHLLVLADCFLSRGRVKAASLLEEGTQETRHFPCSIARSRVSLKNELGPVARGFHHCYIQ